jgi:Protein of unknown function (DUF3108)
MRFLTALLLTLWIPSAEAQPTSAIYAFSWAGLDIGQVELRLTADADSYELNWQSRTTGWFGTLFPFLSDGTATGRIEGKSYRPTAYTGRSEWRDGGSRWHVAFASDGRVSQVDVPPEDIAEREPVPLELQVGPDPASLALSAVARAGPGFRLTARSFDGRRAFAYHLSCAKAESGPAPPELACTIGAQLLAGASRRGRAESSDGSERKPIRVWLRRAGDGQYWPTLLEADSRFGTVSARLVSMAPSPAAG